MNTHFIVLRLLGALSGALRTLNILHLFTSWLGPVLARLCLLVPEIASLGWGYSSVGRVACVAHTTPCGGFPRTA